ncbi:MAG: MurR/RpiR family transcriptional regulator, partial [Lachnospiraceae bacterium]|nr:MurR/RpiR family transcriptional regulator [Lachnospiraceae bacterium]
MDSHLKETIFDRIKMVESYATKQEKAIIEFIRTHQIKDMILLSITEFSERVGVGDATMLRFCRKLGLKGYSEFRFLLSQSEGELEKKTGREADVIFEDMVMALKSTHEILDEVQIEKAADIILRANHVYAFGSGNSGVAAQELCNKILRLGVHCEYKADAHFQLITTSLLTEKDALVLFSVSGSTQDMLELAKCASRQGTP